MLRSLPSKESVGGLAVGPAACGATACGASAVGAAAAVWRELEGPTTSEDLSNDATFAARPRPCSSPALSARPLTLPPCVAGRRRPEMPLGGSGRVGAPGTSAAAFAAPSRPQCARCAGWRLWLML